jgi:hypothetical protein
MLFQVGISVFVLSVGLIVVIVLRDVAMRVAENHYQQRSRIAFESGQVSKSLALALKSERQWKLNSLNGSPASRCRDLARLRAIASQISACVVGLGLRDPTGGLASAVASCNIFFQNRANFLMDGRMMRSTQARECLALLDSLRDERLRLRTLCDEALESGSTRD